MNRYLYLLILAAIVSLPLAAQNASTVQGRVTDEAGEALPGVTILLENTTSGTGTDDGGRYTIRVPRNGILLFDCIGYKSVREPVRGRSSIDVVLAEDNNYLDEAVGKSDMPSMKI